MIAATVATIIGFANSPPLIPQTTFAYLEKAVVTVGGAAACTQTYENGVLTLTFSDGLQLCSGSFILATKF